VGSPERAISARTAGVVRALGWIESIRPLPSPAALDPNPRSARHIPRPPNAPDPNNVPRPDSYYASLDSPYKAAPVTAQDVLELGRTLANIGSANARVQACGNCHGPEGEGQPPTFPQLAGQYATYAQAQLDAFRQGHRRNDVAAVMREIAGSLSEQEITAVSAYLESVRP